MANVSFAVKHIALIALLTLLSSVFFCYASVTLQYAEGWGTFYYDCHFIAELGIQEFLRRWFLQFFAVRWIGVSVMTTFLIVFHLIIYVCVRKWIKGFSAALTAFVVSVIMGCGITDVMCSELGGVMACFDADNRQFHKLSLMVKERQYDEIIEWCDNNAPVANLLYQNDLNLALAEKHQLGDRLLDNPCPDISSIYVAQIPNHYIAAHLSDIYYSMGHVAQSQRYAFEANEKMNNMSPRLLQRLVYTNIIYGQTGVAKKYLYWLRKTIFYKRWADECLASIDKDDNPEILAKRKCLFPDNRFSGIKGLDDDLLHIARNTRGTKQCLTTLNYLGSLYILSGYTDQFVNMVDEFVSNGELNRPLPKYFEQYYNHLKKQ